jgi:hypothetical protein
MIDSLSGKIDEGLARCTNGIIIIAAAFSIAREKGS